MFYFICRAEGGMLHIHGNVNDSDESLWLDNVVKSITNIAKTHGTICPFIHTRVAKHSTRLKLPSYATVACHFCLRTVLERHGGACRTRQMVRSAYTTSRG